WDMKNKQSLVSVEGASTRTAVCDDDPQSVAQHNDGARHVTVHLPLASKAECDAAASATAERLGSTYVYAEGGMTGDPRLRAGVAIGVGKAGGRIDGQYTVTRASHSFTGDGYETNFIASGAHDRSLHGLVAGNGATTIAGVVVAIVTSASDPEQLG